MKFITVKSKQTTVSVDLVPPLVLGDKQRISLVDIRIPEQYFEFTKDQAIGDDGRYVNQLEIIHFSKPPMVNIMQESYSKFSMVTR